MKKSPLQRILCAALFSCFATTCTAEEVYDPIEPVNRGVFWFNENFDEYLLAPVADGYDYVMPDDAQVGVTNFFKNLRYPTYLISDIAQLEFGQAVEHTGRFLINTTVGLLGFIDVATDLGLEEKEEDFGLALASYGIPSGPYIVLPFFGPSNLRDTVGLVVDTITNPTYLINFTNASSETKFWVSTGGTALKAVQWRVNLDDAIRASRAGSLDYYTFAQSSYYQYREGQIRGDKPLSSNPESIDIDKELDEITATESKNAE